VQDCDAEGETDECIDSETDEDFFESEFDDSRVMILVVPFLTVSKASFKLPCLSFKCLAFFICKGNENGGQKAVVLPKTTYISLFTKTNFHMNGLNDFETQEQDGLYV